MKVEFLFPFLILINYCYFSVDTFLQKRIVTRFLNYLMNCLKNWLTSESFVARKRLKTKVTYLSIK